MVVVAVASPAVSHRSGRWGDHVSEVGTEAWLRDVVLDLDFCSNQLAWLMMYLV